MHTNILGLTLSLSRQTVPERLGEMLEPAVGKTTSSSSSGVLIPVWVVILGVAIIPSK
jgi:hypothetical protein